MIKARFYFFVGGLIVGWGLLLLKASQVQILPNPRLEELKARQYQTRIQVRSRRGAILDRRGRELAISVPKYSLFADPKVIKSPQMTGRKLAKILGGEASAITRVLRDPKRRFVWLRRKISREKRDQIQALKIRGLGFVEEPERSYPNDTLMAQVLGFVGTEDKGLEGLELRLEKTLRAQESEVLIQKDARGRPLILSGRLFSDHPDGEDVQLTIDAELQFRLETELMHALDEFDADAAQAVILDARSFEILAMANVPSFNANSPFKFDRGLWRNRSVTDAYEPGSTLKPFLMAVALEKGIVRPNTRYDCENGQWKVGSRTIKEADTNHAFGNLTVSEILAKSSNICAAKVGLDLGASRLRAGLKRFGFGGKSGGGWPGETSGILPGLPWSKHDLMSISFGHGMAASTLQMAAAYAALANGGILKRPAILRSEVETQEGRRVLSESVARQMRLLLAGVTAPDATGYRARVPGIPVGGKTGTAQMVSPSGGYEKEAYIASFGGFLPAQDPRIVVYLSIHRPRSSYYASEVAAPVFSRVAGFAARKLGVAPVLLSAADVLNSPSDDRPRREPLIHDIQTVPDLLGLTLREVYRITQPAQIEVRVNGSGRVAALEPSVGEPLPPNRTLGIVLEDTK